MPREVRKGKIESVFDCTDIRRIIRNYTKTSEIKSYLRVERLFLTIGIAAIFDYEIDIEKMIANLEAEPDGLFFEPKEPCIITGWSPRQKSETMIDIAYNGGHMAARGQIAIEDSREFVSTVRALAGEFEKTIDPDDPEVNYIFAIDAFAEKKLTERYGSENREV